jgi:hypothetical protein
MRASVFALICCLLLSLITLVLVGVDILIESKPRWLATLDNGASASRQLSAAAAEQRAFILQQERLWNDPKTQKSIGSLLRAGDDLARLVDRGQSIFRRIDTDILPGATKVLETTDETLKAATGTLNTTNKTILDLGDRAGKTIDEAQSTIKAGGDLLRAVELRQALGNINRATAELPGLAQSIKVAADKFGVMEQQIIDRLPSLLDEIVKGARSGAGILQIIETKFSELSAKPSRFQRVLGAALTVLRLYFSFGR